MTRVARWKFIGSWLLVSLVAAGVCSLCWPAVHFSDEYLPFGNDAFYHARRILDTVADPSSFYEFDKKIHAPEGSLLTWPWGYDYAMAWLVKAGLALGLAGSPMAILVWLPVAAVFLSIGLIMLVARRLGLSPGLVVIAGLAAALSPLTQYLHGVGQIDHHFAEYIFVLATMACGLRWFARPEDTKAAIILGTVLGTAPAIHNGLFILQVPVLVSLLVLWLQNIRVPMRAMLAFAGALLLTTLAILIPSLPFRLGLFEFYTLSWFHLYIAVGTAVTALALTSFARSNRNIAILAALAILLLLPLLQQVIVARSFLSGTILRLDAIDEARPLATLARSPAGRRSLSLMYSLLIWLLPLTAILCAVKGWQERATGRVFFWLCCMLGLALLVTQLRLHYFGSFALYLPWLVWAGTAARRAPAHHKRILLLVSLGLLLAYWMPARYELGANMALAGDPNFPALRPILGDLQQACAKEPGIVLADNDAGHYIRYYTQCSVIANNFLLTRQHEDKIRQIDHLRSLSAQELPSAAPYVRYVLLRPAGIELLQPGTRYASYSRTAAQLVKDLLLKPLDQVPPNYVLVGQANLRASRPEDSVPYIRVFKVIAPAPDENTATPSPNPAAH